MQTKEPQTVALVSLGCPKNLVDSEKILAHLAEGGLVVGAPMDDADVIVINTCGFIAPARAESLDVISEALRQKQKGRTQRVVVAGCLVNRDAERLWELAPGIDAIVGVNDREDILQAVVASQRVEKFSAVSVDPDGGGSRIFSDAGRFRLMPRHTAYLRISEGCSRGCAFCTIPSIRGPFRSKTPQQVLAEARELISDGCVELNVIGQDTTSFGRDLDGESLPVLLRSLDGLGGVRWIRLMYAYPLGFTDELIETIASCRNVVPYVDLPLQHISDRILRRMQRGVCRKDVENLLTKIRRQIEDVAIRTTFIVGFPGERDEDFEELLEFVRDFRFDAMGVFEFSPEAGTAAATFDGQIANDEAVERAETLMLAQQEVVFAENRKKVGQSIEVLVDGCDQAGGCFGRYYGQAPEIDGVCLLTRSAETGRFVRGRVVDWKDYDLIVSIDQ